MSYAGRVRSVNRKELWNRINDRPRNTRFEEVERLLLLCGWQLERQHGSHVFYKNGDARISVPFRRGTILAAYVREVLNRTRDTANE